MTDSNKVADVFDTWAEKGRAEGMERGHDLGARTGFAKLELEPTSRYLDIGCGNGYTVRWAASHSNDVRAVGIDVSPKMIERATEQSKHLANTEFICGPYPHSFDDQAFDCIFSMEVFYYLPDMLAALKNTRRILAPGGRFVCVVDHYRENGASHNWGPDMGLDLHLYSEDAWHDLFAQAEFVGIRQERVRAEPPEGTSADEAPTWQQTEGSLLTLGRAPDEG